MSGYRTWAGSLLHPQERLLPGIGARLGRYPRASGAVLGTLRRLPSRRARAFAYRRVAQPLVRRMEGELVVPAAGGVRAVAYLDGASGRALATTGVWEWNVGEVIRRTLRPGDVFVDVGANEGYYTVLGGRLVGAEGHVYALEPGPGTHARLVRNVVVNGFEDRVTALQLAAGAGESTATLYGRAGGHDATSSLRRRPDGAAGTATEVAVAPLAAVVAAEHRERLRLVKIDVEGHEDDVLRGLEPLLAEGRLPAILVEVHASYNAAAPDYLVDFCGRHRLRARWLEEDCGTTDDHLAPIDRRLGLRDLGDPPDVHALGRERFAVLLDAREP